jgi:hypothetical protein
MAPGGPDVEKDHFVLFRRLFESFGRPLIPPDLLSRGGSKIWTGRPRKRIGHVRSDRVGIHRKQPIIDSSVTAAANEYAEDQKRADASHSPSGKRIHIIG